MSELIPVHTQNYTDLSEARAYYAGLRCVGVPRQFVTLTETPDDDGNIVLSLLSNNPNDPTPPGFPRPLERMEAKLASYNGGVERLGQALLQITGWQCQHTIEFSPRQMDYVFSVGVVPQQKDPKYDKKMAGLKDMMKKLQRETGIEAPMHEATFDANHPLHQYSDSGIAFEFPLSPAFLKLETCRTLDAYSRPSR